MIELTVDRLEAIRITEDDRQIKIGLKSIEMSSGEMLRVQLSSDI